MYSPNQRYTHKVLHRKSPLTVPADPYGFTGFMKVHLSYTAKQKEKVKHFPPLPERRKIEEKEYSPYMIEILEGIEEKTKSKKSQSETLVYDLSDKDQYCILQRISKVSP